MSIFYEFISLEMQLSEVLVVFEFSLSHWCVFHQAKLSRILILKDKILI